MTLRTERIRTLDQIRAFLEGNEAADFQPTRRDSVYALVRRTLVRFEYHGLRKLDKGLVKRYLEKVTGLSRAQVTRLIKQHRRTGHIRDHRGKPPANAFARRYTDLDAALLAEVDDAFGQLSGPATKVILWRMYEVFGDVRFVRLASISNGHIYNLRTSRSYRTGRLTFRKTQPTPVPIGIRRKPQPNGEPGYVRVDTVHLGDQGGKKGIYILNFHRPCLFPTEITGPTGRIRRRYRQEDVATPYEKFKALRGAEGFLRPRVTLDALDRLAAAATPTSTPPRPFSVPATSCSASSAKPRSSAV